MINWIKNLFKKPEPPPAPVAVKPKTVRGRPKKINKIDTKDK